MVDSSSSTAPKEGWSKSDIEQFIASEELKYQSIDLPYGLSTPGSRRDELCKLAFSDPIKGRSVLDVGSYLGYFCLRALEEGAVSAHGLEIDPVKVRQANIIAQIKGLNPTYDTVDFETQDLGKKYDIVLALNILHHFFDPVGALQKLARITNEKLVLEVASLNPRDARKIGIGFLKQLLISQLPIIFVAPGTPHSKRRSNVQKYFFTPASIRRILEDHTKLFSRVEIIPSKFKQRFIVVATRRKIKHLVIVSGLTSSGKSTFLRHCKEGTLPRVIAEKLPSEIKQWPQIGATRLLKNPSVTLDGKVFDAANSDGLVFHYDILRPYAQGTQEYGRDQALDLIQCADKVTVIVLINNQDVLQKQLVEGEIKGASWKKKLLNGLVSSIVRFSEQKVGALLLKFIEIVSGRRIKIRTKSRHKKLLGLYSKPGWVEAWIDRWHAYLRSHGEKIEVIDVKWP